MRALEQSVREGRIQSLASLLEPRLVAAASAPLPGTTDKSTLLHLACELGNTACAQLLVEWAPQSQHAFPALPRIATPFPYLAAPSPHRL